MQNGAFFVDHVFMLVEPHEVDDVVAQLSKLGLTESCRRSHTGLGTANIFFCFDNAFLEILWIRDREEARGSRLGRMLIERVDGRKTGAAPFGIGFRTSDPSDAVPFETFTFEPPAALSFKPIPIAKSSADSAQPVLFRAQRAFRPDSWTDGRAGVRQQPAGLAEIASFRYTPPRHVAPSADLQMLESLGMLALDDSHDGPRMVFTLTGANGGPSRELSISSPLG